MARKCKIYTEQSWSEAVRCSDRYKATIVSGVRTCAFNKLFKSNKEKYSFRADESPEIGSCP